MKKLAIAALAALSFAASAADINGFLTTDYIRSTSDPQASKYEYHLGGVYKNEYGAFDGAVIGIQKIDSIYSTAVGGEAGYTYTYKQDAYRFSGRASLGDASSNWYYGLTAEAAYKVDPRVDLFAQYRWRDGFTNDTPSSNRYSLGADVMLKKDLAMRVGYTYTDTMNRGFNGFTGGFVVGF